MSKPLIDQIEEVLDRKLDEKLDSRFSDFEKKFDHKLGAFMEQSNILWGELAGAYAMCAERCRDGGGGWGALKARMPMVVSRALLRRISQPPRSDSFLSVLAAKATASAERGELARAGHLSPLSGDKEEIPSSPVR